MNTMNDNIVQGCYLQYLLSKYISKSCCDSKVQELETRYNTIDPDFKNSASCCNYYRSVIISLLVGVTLITIRTSTLPTE